jgi:hypothetical protein
MTELEDSKWPLEMIDKGEATTKWYAVNGLAIHSGRVFVPAMSTLWLSILATAHGAGHEGVQKTLHHLRATTTSPSSSKTMSGVVLCVSAISLSISIRRDYCSLSSCLVWYGPTSPWTSWRAFLASVESQWS